MGLLWKQPQKTVIIKNTVSKSVQIFIFFVYIRTAQNEVRAQDGKQFKIGVIQTGKKHQRIRKTEWNGCGRKLEKIYYAPPPPSRDVINKTVYTDNFTGRYYWSCQRLKSNGRKYKTLTELYLPHTNRHSTLLPTKEGPKYSFLHQFI